MTKLVFALVLLLQTAGADLTESLWETARAGDDARITAALDKGANVDAKSRYDVTPLIFAASSGHLAAVKLLVERGADVNAQDSFYRSRAVDMSLTNGHEDVAIFLLQKESKGGETALISGASSASPIAADGKLYIASEDGKIYVVTGGTGLTPIATNDMNEVVMATPAISDGMLFVRTLGHLYGIGQ